MFDYILFDLDGTLTDPFDGITAAIFYALDKLDFPHPNKQTLDGFIGPPLSDSFTLLFGGDKQKAERAVILYREYYEPIGWQQNTVYDGIKQTLEELKANRKTLLVATSKPELFAKRIIEKFGFADYFDFIAGASFDSSRATKDKVIEYAIASAQIDKSRAVMVGDRKYDICGAKAVGLMSIGVLYGYGTRAELESAGADFIAISPRDIIKFVI